VSVPYRRAAPVVALALIYLGLGSVLVYRGRVTGDEGWYLAAAKSVQEGRVPYQDFLFTQMPLMPYAYAAALHLVGVELTSGRWVSMLLGAGAIVATAGACHRAAGSVAALVAAALLVLNRNVLYACCSVKTQSLTMFLTAVALWFAAGVNVPPQVGSLRSTRPNGSLLRSAGALVAMNLAVLTRLSMLPALVALWAHAIWVHRGRPRLLVAGLACNGVVAGLIASALSSEGRFWFGVLGFHREYYGNARWEPPYFVEFVKGTVANQLVVLSLFTWAAVVRYRRQKGARAPHTKPGAQAAFLLLVLTCYLGTTLLHATRPIAYPIYQVSNVDFAVVFGAVIMEDSLRRRSRNAALWLGAGVILSALATMPLQECPIDVKGAGSPARSVEARRILRQLAVPGDRLLTFQTELSLGTGLSLLPGLEMSEFSFFPSMSDGRARHLHVVNRRGLREALSGRAARFLCFTPRDFVIMAAGDDAELRSLIDESYEFLTSVESYGQFSEPLIIARARTIESGGASR
jgi:hypothetical protein